MTKAKTYKGRSKGYGTRTKQDLKAGTDETIVMTGPPLLEWTPPDDGTGTPFVFPEKPLGSRAAWACNWVSASNSKLTPNLWGIAYHVENMTNEMLLAEAEDIAHREGEQKENALNAIGTARAEGFSDAALQQLRRAIKRARQHYAALEFVAPWDEPSPELIKVRQERLGWEIGRGPAVGQHAGRLVTDIDPEEYAQIQANQASRDESKAANQQAVNDREEAKRMALLEVEEDALADKMFASFKRRGYKLTKATKRKASKSK